jgi:hypothetical protein
LVTAAVPDNERCGRAKLSAQRLFKALVLRSQLSGSVAEIVVSVITMECDVKK